MQPPSQRLDDDQVGLMVEVFRMLADATRVRVLWALVDCELSVNDLAEHVGKPAPSVSQHLAKLRMARLVRTRRDGTTIFYSLENEHVRQLVSDAVFNAEHASPGVPGHHRGAARSRCCLRAEPGGEGPMSHVETDYHDHPHVHDHPKGLRGVVRETLRPAWPRRHRQRRRCLGVQRDRYPRGQDQPGRTRHHRRVPGGRADLSGSIALAADTIHNFSDALTAIPLWIAFVLGRKAATRRYTYGFGRAEDLAGLFVILMIALSAIIAGYEAIRRMVNPIAIDHLGWVIAAGVIGFVGNELVAVYRIRVGRQIGSAALVADGLHARTDGFTSLAVVFGAVGVWLGFSAGRSDRRADHHRGDRRGTPDGGP